MRRARASESATRRLLSTFYEGSTVRAVSAMLDLSARQLSERELDDLSELIEKARKAGR